MKSQEFKRTMIELARAEAEDERLHSQPATLEERVQSHNRLNRLRSEAARFQKASGGARTRHSRHDKGVRLFPSGS